MYSGTTLWGEDMPIINITNDTDYIYSNWSSEGISTVSITKISTHPFQYNVVCNSSHTTPFVVLVDSQDSVTQVHNICHCLYHFVFFSRSLQKRI